MIQQEDGVNGRDYNAGCGGFGDGDDGHAGSPSQSQSLLLLQHPHYAILMGSLLALTTSLSLHQLQLLHYPFSATQKINRSYN